MDVETKFTGEKQQIRVADLHLTPLLMLPLGI